MSGVGIRIAGLSALALCAMSIANRASSQGSATGLRPVSDFAAIADRNARSVALFEEMGKVITSPRCVNCHPRSDRPRQGDGRIAHNPPVTRGGKSGKGAVGLECATCHGPLNVSFANGQGSIPGHPLWHLAPIEMAWEGKTLGQICAQIKDKTRNGGKTLAQIHEHNGNDSLVGWAWNPGPGRTPAPGTQAQFGELTKAWIDTGAKCPA